jgi:uncharacterized oligopeptide transporter (OPT) family protein
MKTVIEGVLAADLPWSLVAVGGVFAIVVQLLGVPSLPFAVGIYLPLSTTSPIFVGGVALGSFILLIGYLIIKTREVSTN